MPRSPIPAILAWAGVAILGFGVLAAVVGFDAHRAFGFSPANHFISELGWAAVSDAARLFNFSLLAGSLCLIPFVISLRSVASGRLGPVAAGAGLCALIAGFAVGLFPLDHLKPHLTAAVIFFWANLICIALFSIHFRRANGPARSPVLLVSGAVCCLLGIAFLAYPKAALFEILRAGGRGARPPIYGLALLEWLYVAATLLWLAITLALVRSAPPASR